MKCNHSKDCLVTIFVFSNGIFLRVTFLVMFLQAFDFPVMPLQAFDFPVMPLQAFDFSVMPLQAFDFSVMPLQASDFSVMSLQALTFQSCQGQIVSVLFALRSHGYNYTFA